MSSEEPEVRDAPEEPAEPLESSEGVDLTLVRWTLDMTPAERLAALTSAADSLVRMRRGNPS